MTVFELQSKMTRDWFAVAEDSTRRMSEACLSAGKETAKAMDGAAAVLAPKPVSPFEALFSWPWGQAAPSWSRPAYTAFVPTLPMPSPMNPFAWSPSMMTPSWGATWPMASLWPSPMPAIPPWSFAPATPSPMASAAALQDVFATAYRTASGFATAVIASTSLEPAKPAAPQDPWQMALNFWTGGGR